MRGAVSYFILLKAFLSLIMNVWITIERPGYLGKHRDEKQKEWDQKYGKGNWQLVWQWGDQTLDFLGACMIYEDAYFNFLKLRPEILGRLVSEASEVYDDEPSNITSGLNFLAQETKRTHMQDIAIRRCVVRFGTWFQGQKPIRIRQEKGNHELSMILSPGRAPFHMPEKIIQPQLTGWWHPDTVESWYQSNKVLQATNMILAVEEKWRSAVVKCLETGETEKEFMEHLESGCQKCLAIIEKRFKESTIAFEKIAELIKKNENPA